MTSWKSVFKKQFCLWLVPAGSGTVKKVRFSARRALGIVGLILTVSFGLLYVAGDYARVQFTRVQEAISYAAIQAKNSALSNEASNLAASVAKLRAERDSLESAQTAVKSRVLELHNLLSEMKATGLIRDEPGNVASSVGDAGIGGEEEPELESEKKEEVESGIGGEDLALDEVPLGPQNSLANRSALKLSQTGLVHELDRMIDRLRVVPLGYPGNGYVNSQYGPRRSPFTRRVRMHQGVDIALPHGSYVHTTADGVVEAVKRTSSYGLVIDIKHSDGVITRYAHLSKALVREGEKVCRGEYLGLVGNSGMSTGPHLHYEIRVDGEAIDPMPLLMIPNRVEFASLL